MSVHLVRYVDSLHASFSSSFPWLHDSSRLETEFCNKQIKEEKKNDKMLVFVDVLYWNMRKQFEENLFFSFLFKFNQSCQENVSKVFFGF